MRWLTQLRMRVKMLFGRGKAAAHLDAELRDHLQRQIEENIAAGMTADEARFAALRMFGNPALLREQARANWNWTGLESMLRDVRHGARTLRRTPGFAAIAIIVIALGIGANVAMFTIIRSVILKPLPFTGPDRLAMLYESGVGDDAPFINVSGGTYAEWAQQNHSFSDLALLGASEFNLTADGGALPEHLRGASCTWNLLKTLGVKPVLGRDFTSDDDRYAANGTVLLSWGLWKRRFGGDASIVNRSIRLNSRSYTVIGVLPSWFAFPDASTQLWTPVYHDKPAAWMESLGNHPFQVVGRLLPGVSAGEGVADLRVISRRLHNTHLDNPFVGKSADTRPLLESMVGEVKRPLYMLFAATGCVLLIVCLNVANLLVARGAARRKEQAIRVALGGGRLRLLREHLMESLLVAIAGGAAGMVLAWAAIQWLASTRPDLSRVETVHIDSASVVFAAGLIALCALFAGVIGSVVSRDARLLASLQESSRAASAGQGRVRLRKGLLVAEVGLTVVLLVCAGLLMKSYQRLRSSDMGCVTDNVLTMRLDLFGARYRQPGQLVNFYSELLQRVKALPGVDAVGFSQAIPGQGYFTDDAFAIVEHPPLPKQQAQFAMNRSVDPGFFGAMGIPILRGHTFDSNRKLDQADQAMINAAFARQYFPAEDPLGKHLRLDGRTYEICGVVGDTRPSPAEDMQPVQYYPLFTGLLNNGTLAIRSTHDVDQLALPVQRIVQSLDRDLPVSDVMTMEQLLGKSTVDASFDATLLAVFAGLSLLLAAVGLFGVLSYIVAQRTGEIGIRIALGARREQMLRKVLLDGLRPALLGLVLGLAASVAAAKEIASMLYGIEPLDAAVFVGVSGALLLVAALACAVPAWRASRLDPMQALRTE
jgi:predicted permease